MRAGVATIVAGVVLLGVAERAAAHDLWLVPDASSVAAGTAIEVRGQTNSRFPTSESAVAGSCVDWDAHWATLVFHAGGDSRATGDSSARTDSSDVADAVNRYHHALETGDSAAALALLTDDAVILESGGSETRAEYRSHHLPSDIAFARAVKSLRSSVNVTVKGDVAWASSTSTTEGEFRGRPVNSAGAELMVLVRAEQGWKIAAIHWSSRTRRP
jgi:ketosteroid isomerase-like protein